MCLALAPWIALLAASGPAALIGETGPPRVGGTFSPLRLYDRVGYEVEVKRFPQAIVGRWPETLPEEAHYGFLTAGDTTRSLVVYSSDDRIELILDVDADGDVTDDSVRAMKADGGTGFRGGPTYSVSLTIDPAAPFRLAVEQNDDGTLRPLLHYYNSTIREGEIRLGDRTVKFAVGGRSGVYDREHNEVFFDVDGDGWIETGRYDSDELYRLQEGFVNLDGRTYAFSVSPGGERLTLTPEAETRPGRVRLDPGNSAPDFEFEDLDGEAHRLGDYEGRIVLLYSWSTWCGPCVKDTPLLVEAYEQYQELGFEILGVNANEAPETVVAYVREKDIRWTQVQQSDAGWIQHLYRIDGLPGYYLIDRDGTIVDRSLRGPTLGSRIEALMRQQPGQSELE